MRTLPPTKNRLMAKNPIYIWFLPFIFLFCTSNAEDFASIKYGSLAGSITGYTDNIGAIATIELTDKTDSSRKIHVERFHARQFVIDSIPAGEYNMILWGDTYDAAYQLLDNSNYCDNVTVGIAPDSMTIIQGHFLPENNLNPQPRIRIRCIGSADSIISDNKTRMEYEVYKRMTGGKRTLCFRCGTYAGRINGYDTLYVPTDTAINSSLKMMPAFFTDGGLSVDLMSHRIYSTNGYKIEYNEMREGNNIYLHMRDVPPESGVENPEWRRPATGSHQLDLAEGRYNLYLIASDTSIYSIDVSPKQVDIGLIDSGRVDLSTAPLVWKDRF